MGRRMADQENHGFQFIMHGPNEPLLRENHSKIRRHAMKAVGAVRRVSNSSHAQSKSPSKYYTTHRDSRVPNLPPPMPLSGLELLVKDQSIDPLDLSSLTSVHAGPMYVTHRQYRINC